MEFNHIIGADISKKTIDLCSLSTNQFIQIENNLSGFKELLPWFKNQSIALNDVFLVMEHTGYYSLHFENFLHGSAIAFKKVNGLEIKRSLGIIRGKDDKIDARRIALYGFEKRHKLTAEDRTPESIKRLQMLQSTRDRLVKSRTALRCAIQEYENLHIKETDLLIKSQIQVIKALDKQIESIEREIQKIITSHQELKKNYDLIVSIIGVGPVVATAAIIKTNNFTRFRDGRKFACFCGTAPFKEKSGTSINKKAKVSHLADKEMKTLLELAARSAIQHDKEIKEYFERRILQGKSKQSTLNVVRNKIIYRMFAVINRQTPFIKDFLKVA